MQLIKTWPAAVLGLALMAAAAAADGGGALPTAVDLGSSANAAGGGAPVSFTVSLKLRDSDRALDALRALYTPGSDQYRHFLTPQQFAARFAPAPATVAAVTQHFRAAGMRVTQLTATQLSVTGSAAAVNAEFGVQMHEFEVPSSAKGPGYRYHSPVGAPKVAAAIAGAVQGVVGLDSRPRYHPHLEHSAAIPAHPSLLGVAGQGGGGGGGGTTNAPGLLTVSDFAQYYDVNPIYKSGVNGSGSTIGIVTLAAFTPSDAYAYWQSVGLTVAPNRIHEIQIDGGSGAPSDVSGSIETTLDVEQSGGIAPGANIDVYEAPNTSQGFIDAFAAVIDANVADTISVSWGEWEFFDTLTTGGPVVDPVTGSGNASSLQAFNDLFLQAALQGQSMYVASGDSGAYDSTLYFTPPAYPPPKGSVVLSVDDPAVQPWVTAVGGTTLPGTQTFGIPGGKTFSINVANEQAWGWDYLIPLCTVLGFDPISCGIYSVGSGGGVSSFMPMPFYQEGIRGIRTTEAHQTLLDYSQSPPVPVAVLPAHFEGRNLPDIALNADPETGYIIVYTSDQTGFGVASYYGGTSFAAPQFNGVTALYDQAVGGRVGLLNFALYGLAREGDAYEGRSAPLRDITNGDNWYYHSHAGYDQATGLGVPDFTNLLKVLGGGEGGYSGH